MKGYSSDIELAFVTVLEGLVYEIDLNTIDDDKLRQAMDGRVMAFKHAKDILHKWQNHPSAPSEEKLKHYVQQLVNAGDASIGELRNALRKEINYDDLEPTKVANAVKAKSTILIYIDQLNSNLQELRLQLDGDVFQLGDREFKLGYPERYARGDFYPESKYHKNWYNEEEDAVMICPNGTKGKIIELSGLKIQLPKQPPKKQMLNYGKKKADQYWQRQEMPKGLNPDNEDSFAEYILEEFRRRREGVWFLNNGEPVYLTGHAYFGLQWGKMRDNGGYMDFRHAQLDMYYFAEACIRDARCLGEFFVKSRRTGFTYVTLTIMLNDATSTRNVNLGLTSQNDEDAKRAFQKFAYMFRNLPFFFRPVVKGAVDSDKILEFALPSDKSKAAKLARENKGKDYLNSRMDYEATKDAAYDGQKMYRYLGDEASKWKKPANYLNHFGRISPTFDEGGQIVGKAFIGSTVNPMKQGGEEFKKLYYLSQISDRDELTERTPSGLYGYFLPAHKNMTKFTDKYGVCHEVAPEKPTYNVNGELIKKGSIEFLEARRKAKRRKSEIAYNEELRAFPMQVGEALRDDAKNAIFPIEKLNEQIEYVDNLPSISRYVSTGNFMWENGVPDTKVVWYPDPNGRFKVTWIPSVEHRNNVRTVRGMKEPMNAHFGCFGCDSYDISGTVSGKGSKGSLHGVTGFSMHGDVPDNHFFLEYINRTGLAEEFYEDVLMACVFYGMPILVENNKPRILYHFKNRGYRKFCLNRPDKPLNKLSKSEKELGGVPSSSKDMITTHASFIENFIVNFVGVYDEEDENQRVREYGSMGSMFFMETLQDWLSFDITNREKHDATISTGYALMGLRRAELSPAPEIKKINMGMSTFSQKGFRSTLKTDNE